MDGGCACSRVRYRLAAAPMIVHCCHCSWCQTETGSAFVINAVIERDRLEITGDPSVPGGAVEPLCGRGPKGRVRARGTLDAPGDAPPDVHIFTSTRLPWVVLPEGVPAFEEFYPDPGVVWSAEARARWKALIAGGDREAGAA